MKHVRVRHFRLLESLQRLSAHRWLRAIRHSLVLLLPVTFVGALALLAIYFVGAEQGATSLVPGMYVHEFVHDGRHLLGFPCH